MTEKIIIFGIIGLAVSVALSVLKRGAAKQFVHADNGQFILRMHKLYAILSIIGFALGLLIAIMNIISGELIIAGIALLIFLGTGIPCGIYYINHRLTFDDKFIEVKSFLGKTNSIQWVGITKISFNHFSGLLSISDNKGITVKIHQHLVGLSAFIKTMEEKTTSTAKQLRIPIAE